VRWSVAVVAEGDRAITADEVVELADAVASSNGIASGIGTKSYGAQLLVDAANGDEALELGIAEFRRAASVAGLPEWPVARAEALSEDDDLGDLDDLGDRYELGGDG
jgi:hypothetical protein